MRAGLFLAFVLLAGCPVPAQAVPDEGVVRLLVHDDLRRSYGFTTGEYGTVIQDGNVANKNSQLLLGKDAGGRDVLRFGWQGGERGQGINLGVLRDKATGSSLFWRVGRREAEQRLPEPGPPRAVPVELDHVYLARIDELAVAGNGFEKGDTLFARLHVLDHAPGRYVELRYTILREEPQAPGLRAEKRIEAPAERWLRSTVRRPEDAFDARTLPQLDWPVHVTDAEKEQVEKLVEAVRLGRKEDRAALAALGHKALAGIVNRLRKLDYLDADQAWYGWQLNLVLEEATAGMNTGYVPVRPGEEVDPRKADWNAKTAEAWGRLLEKYPTQEDWDRLVRARKARPKR